MDCYTITTHLKTSDYYFQTGFRCIGVLGIPVSSSTLVRGMRPARFSSLWNLLSNFSSTHLKGHVGYSHHDPLEQENVQYKPIGYSDIHSSVDIRYLYSNIVNWHTFAYSVENW